MVILAIGAGYLSYNWIRQSSVQLPSHAFGGSIEIGARENVAVTTQLKLVKEAELTVEGGCCDQERGPVANDVILSVDFRAQPQSTVTYLVAFFGEARLKRVTAAVNYRGDDIEGWTATADRPTVSDSDDSLGGMISAGSQDVEYSPYQSQIFTGTVPVNRGGHARMDIAGTLTGTVRAAAAARTAVALPGIFALGHDMDGEGDPFATMNMWDPTVGLAEDDPLSNTDDRIPRKNLKSDVPVDARIIIEPQSRVPGAWRRPSRITARTLVGMLPSDDIVVFASPQLVNPAALEWSGSAPISYVLQNETRRARFERLNFAAGALAGLAGALLIEALLTLAHLRSRPAVKPVGRRRLRPTYGTSARIRRSPMIMRTVPSRGGQPPLRSGLQRRQRRFGGPLDY
jgi:hypothetical protein